MVENKATIYNFLSEVHTDVTHVGARYTKLTIYSSILGMRPWDMKNLDNDKLMDLIGEGEYVSMKCKTMAKAQRFADRWNLAVPSPRAYVYVKNHRFIALAGAVRIRNGWQPIVLGD
jgi:hypothetical protein